MTNDIEWKMVKLGDICDIRMGQSPEGQFYNDKQIGLPLIQGNADIENRKTIIRSYTSYITKTCDDGDYILSVRAPVGAIAKATFKACIGRGVCAFSYPNDYLYQYFIFIENRWGEVSTGSTFDSINGPALRKVLIPIPYKNGTPDLEMQKQIAQKLGDMDSLIAAKEILLAKKRNLKVAAMQKLIKDEEGENWKKVKIGDYLRVKTGSKNTEDKIDDGKYPLYVRSPIVERINEYTHDCEAVLTAGDGVGTGKVFHYVNGKFAAHQRVYVISNFTEIDGKYFYYQFSQNFYDEVMKYTAKSSVDSVRRGMITGMEIALPFNSDGSPDLIEQRRIASILSDMDSEIAAIEKEITKLQNLKTAMMQKMFCFGDSNSSSE